MVDCCIYRHVSGTVPSSYCGARLPSHYRRTIHQLQLPAMFLVYVLPLLLQSLSEIKIWLIGVYIGTYQALFLHPTVERGCLPTTAASIRHCSSVLLWSEAAFPLPPQEEERSTSCNSQRCSSSTSFLFSSKHLAKLKYGWLLCMCTYQTLFLSTTVERGCLPTTTAKRRTMHQLQLLAMFLVYVLPLLLQILSETKYGWSLYCGARLLSHYHRKKKNDPPAATPSDIPRPRPSSSPPNT